MKKMWVMMTGCEGCFSFESERTSSEQRAYSDILRMEISCLGKKDDIESLSTRSTKRQRERQLKMAIREIQRY